MPPFHVPVSVNVARYFNEVDDNIREFSDDAFLSRFRIIPFISALPAIFQEDARVFSRIDIEEHTGDYDALSVSQRNSVLASPRIMTVSDARPAQASERIQRIATPSHSPNHLERRRMLRHDTENMTSRNRQRLHRR